MKFRLVEYLDRNQLISKIKDLGFNYKFDKYSDEALFNIYQERKAVMDSKNNIEEPVVTELPSDFDFYTDYNDYLIYKRNSDNDYMIKGLNIEFPSEEEALDYIDSLEESLTESDKKKKGAFGWFSSLNPGDKKKSPIMPDKPAGIDIFNHNMTYNKDFNSSSDSASSAGSADGGAAGGGE